MSRLENALIAVLLAAPCVGTLTVLSEVLSFYL